MALSRLSSEYWGLSGDSPLAVSELSRRLTTGVRNEPPSPTSAVGFVWALAAGALQLAKRSTVPDSVAAATRARPARCAAKVTRPSGRGGRSADAGGRTNPPRPARTRAG